MRPTNSFPTPLTTAPRFPSIHPSGFFWARCSAWYLRGMHTNLPINNIRHIPTIPLCMLLTRTTYTTYLRREKCYIRNTREHAGIRENILIYSLRILLCSKLFLGTPAYSCVYLLSILTTYTYLDERREYTRACKTHGHGIHTNNTMQERTKKSSCN